MRVVQIGELKIGEGKPKICVPMMGKTIDALIVEAQEVSKLPADLVEWRVDHFADWTSFSQVKAAAKAIAQYINVPILFTFRTAEEGGESAIGKEPYKNLLSQAAILPEISLIDVEIYFDTQAVKNIISNVHAAGKFVIASNHDFEKTPPKDEIIKRLCYMEQMGADISKIAVMPQEKSDVVMLLSATMEMYDKYATGPIVTMSMSRTGVVSRVIGESTGSAITFGAAGKASAPGQIPAEKMAELLEALHTIV